MGGGLAVRLGGSAGVLSKLVWNVYDRSERQLLHLLLPSILSPYARKN